MKQTLFIGGQWQAPVRGGTFDVVDPATEQLIHKAPAGTAEDIDKAVKAARHAFDTGPWPRMSGRERATYLRAISDIILARKHELGRLEVLDNGKPLPEAVWDMEDAAGCFAYYAGLAEQMDDKPEETIPLGDVGDRGRLSAAGRSAPAC